MTNRRSRLPLIVACVYAVIALVASLWDLLSPAPPGSWLVLRGIGVCIVTLPVCYVVENVFPWVGLPRPDFYAVHESVLPWIALAAMIFVCAAMVYGVTAWIQRRFGRRPANRL